MTTELSIEISDEGAMQQFAVQLAPLCTAPMVIYLSGPLGAGKTTLSRYFIQALGHQGNVKSPTYTLVEPYSLSSLTLYHFDLYRLGNIEELEYVGIRDYFHPQSLCLIEWPEKGEGMLPPADLWLQLSYLDNGRHIQLTAKTAKGERLLAAWLDNQTNSEHLH